MASSDVVASMFRGGQRRRGWRRSEYVYGARSGSRRRVTVLVAECVRCLGAECVREGY